LPGRADPKNHPPPIDIKDHIPFSIYYLNQLMISGGRRLDGMAYPLIGKLAKFLANRFLALSFLKSLSLTSFLIATAWFIPCLNLNLSITMASKHQLIFLLF